MTRKRKRAPTPVEQAERIVRRIRELEDPTSYESQRRRANLIRRAISRKRR